MEEGHNEMRIQHNIEALNTSRNLNLNNTKASKALEKLSSGYKINRAGDDAAGLAISEKMRSQIRGLDMAKKNTQAQVSILSNGTRAHIPAIFAALRKVDKPIMKIDAPTNEWIAKINRPAPGYDVRRVIDALKQFNGDFILQTMMLQSVDFDSANPEIVNPWMDIVRELRPREIMVYTIDRPTPQEGLVKFSEEKMRQLVQPLIEEGFNIQIRG